LALPDDPPKERKRRFRADRADLRFQLRNSYLGEWHLPRVLNDFVTYLKTRRPHQGSAQQCPVPLSIVSRVGTVQRRDVLGGILHDYARAAA
jgi:hypothetical protein